MLQVEDRKRLNKDAIQEINNLIESTREDLAALGGDKKLDKIKLHQQRIVLYTQLFNLENDVKYRKKILNEHKSIVDNATDLKSLDISLTSITKIIEIYRKLSKDDRVKEWEQKKEKVKSSYAKNPGVIIIKINQIKKEIEKLKEDILCDESKIIELHIEALKFYERLFKSEIDKECGTKYRKEYADQLKIVVRKFYTQRYYDKALSYTKELIKTCEYLGEDEAVKQYIEAKDKLVNLISSQHSVATPSNILTGAMTRRPSSVTPSNTPTGRTTRDSNFDRFSLDNTPSRYSSPKEALDSGDHRAISYHLSRNQVSPSTKNKYVHLLCKTGQVRGLKQLIQENDKIDVHDKDGNLPIHLATINGHKGLVELLVNNRNERRNSRTQYGKSVLELAIENDRNDIIELLISKGVDVNMKTSDDIEPIVFALQNSKVYAAQQLLNSTSVFFENRSINEHDKYGKAPIHYAVLVGEMSILETLIEKGANVENINLSGETPLELAFCKDYTDIIERLKALGCSADRLSSTVERHMVCAIQKNDLHVVEKLLPKTNGKFTSTYSSAKYCTIVHLAAKLGKNDILKLIIEKKGGDFFYNLASQKDTEVNTAMHLASLGNQADVMNLLIENFISVNDKNDQGKTPLHLAAENGRGVAITILLEKLIDINERDGVSLETPLHLAIKNGHTDIAISLIEKKADFSICNLEGNTPLHLAILYNNSDVAGLLLVREANINARNGKGNTPLHLAVMENNLSIAELLLERGAVVGSANFSHQTPRELIDSYEMEELFNKHLHSSRSTFQSEKLFRKNLLTSFDSDSGIDPSSSMKSSTIEEGRSSSSR